MGGQCVHVLRPDKILTFTVTLDAAIVTDGFTQSRIFVMDEFDGDFLYDGTTEQFTPGFLFEGFNPLARISSSSFSLDENSASGGISDSDSLTVNDGETYYLWMNIVAQSFQGSTDAMVSIEFDDNTGLVSAAPVPEPGFAMALFCGIGLVASIGSRRERGNC